MAKMRCLKYCERAILVIEIPSEYREFLATTTRAYALFNVGERYGHWRLTFPATGARPRRTFVKHGACARVRVGWAVSRHCLSALPMSVASCGPLGSSARKRQLLPNAADRIGHPSSTACSASGQRATIACAAVGSSSSLPMSSKSSLSTWTYCAGKSRTFRRRSRCRFRCCRSGRSAAVTADRSAASKWSCGSTWIASGR